MHVKISNEKFKHHSPEYLDKEERCKKETIYNRSLFKYRVTSKLFFIDSFDPMDKIPAKYRNKYGSDIVYKDK